MLPNDHFFRTVRLFEGSAKRKSENSVVKTGNETVYSKLSLTISNIRLKDSIAIFVIALHSNSSDH